MSDKLQIDKNKLDEFIKLHQYYLEELKQSKTNVNKFEVAEWLIDLGKIIEEGVEEVPVPCASNTDVHREGAQSKTIEERVDDLERTVEELSGTTSCSWSFTSPSDTQCFRITKVILFGCHVITTMAVLVSFVNYLRQVFDSYKNSTEHKVEESISKFCSDNIRGYTVVGFY